MWIEWVIEISNDEVIVGKNVGVVATHRDMPGTGEQAVRIPGDCAVELVVSGFAVCQRVDVDVDQALYSICDENIAVDRMDGLFLVGDPHQLAYVARRIDRLIRR